jgi:hypothetical protein
MRLCNHSGLGTRDSGLVYALLPTAYWLLGLDRVVLAPGGEAALEGGGFEAEVLEGARRTGAGLFVRSSAVGDDRPGVVGLLRSPGLDLIGEHP